MTSWRCSGASASAGWRPPRPIARPGARISPTARSPRLKLIGSYLPAELSDEELGDIVERAVRESGAESVRDMGRAMGTAMAAVDGRADGGRVSGLVKAALGG